MQVQSVCTKSTPVLFPPLCSQNAVPHNQPMIMQVLVLFMRRVRSPSPSLVPRSSSASQVPLYCSAYVESITDTFFGSQTINSCMFCPVLHMETHLMVAVCVSGVADILSDSPTVSLLSAFGFMVSSQPSDTNGIPFTWFRFFKDNICNDAKDVCFELYGVHKPFLHYFTTTPEPYTVQPNHWISPQNHDKWLPIALPIHIPAESKNGELPQFLNEWRFTNYNPIPYILFTFTCVTFSFISTKAWSRNDFSVEPESTPFPFLHSFTTATSNRASVNSNTEGTF